MRLFLLSIFSVFYVAYGQVSSYVFNQSSANYSFLPSGSATIVAAGFQDDNVYGNIPIGFTFTFNNTTYTAVGLSTNGWMSFGGNVPNDNFAAISNSGANAVSYMCGDMMLGPYQTCTITSGSDVVAFTNTLAANFFEVGDVLTGTGIPASTSVVAIGAGNMTISTNATASGTAITAGGRISYVTSGVSPNRVFTLQFKQVGRWNNDGTGQDDYVNAQIKLYETSNEVEIVYGHAGTFNNNVMFAEIGLAGQTSADYNNREVPLGNNWNTSVKGLSNGAKAVYSNSNTIPYGLSYRWIPPAPCSGVPSTNSAVSSFSQACNGGDAFLNLMNTYTLSGLNYIWSASSNSLGPFSPLNTFTAAPYTATNITSDTWYICEITCTNSAQTFTTAPILIKSVSSVTNAIPYFEGFENIPVNDKLPNCSWSASDPNSICQTYTLASTFNRIPKTGNKFAAFKFGTNPGGDYFFTNAMWLYAGYTYSADVSYVTDGGNGWSEFALMIGANQSTTGLQSIASVTGNITNTTYTTLSNTFSVAVSGFYYVAVKAVGDNNPWYLSWDDLSITAPCNFNMPNVLVWKSTNIVCEGVMVTYTATGANSYTWNVPPTTGSVVSHPASMIFTVNVTGENEVNCFFSNSNPPTVLMKPSIVLAPANQTICLNETATVVATGAASYTWNPSNNKSDTFTLSPANSNEYTVVATGTNGCQNTAVTQIVVDPCTGIDELVDNDFKFEIYPNPTNEYLKIAFSKEVQTEIRIIDVNGKIVKTVYVSRKETIIDVKDLAKGMYFLTNYSLSTLVRRVVIIK
ncbi:MAG: T9SS type A sorting domain-containing protein [Bacteroidia bacterium]